MHHVFVGDEWQWALIVFVSPSLCPGGNTSIDNNPKDDGDDGTSFISQEGETFLFPLKGNVAMFIKYKQTHLAGEQLHSTFLYSTFDTVVVFLGEH